MSEIIATCEYCGGKGVYGRDIEIRNGKMVCKDTAACDAREAANSDEEDDPDD